MKRSALVTAIRESRYIVPGAGLVGALIWAWREHGVLDAIVKQ